MFVDTHAHLSDGQFDGDRAEALDRAQAARVDIVVEIADNEGEWAPARAWAERNPGRVYWTAGLHPHHVDQFDPGLPQRLKTAMAHAQCVAAGEIGLDYYRSAHAPDLQKGVFTRLLSTALEENKPVVIHCREADRDARQAQHDILQILQKTLRGAPTDGKPWGVIHCFQGHADFAQACVDLGFLLGVDGPITYPSAAGLRGVLEKISLEHLVLETDSPYLPPQSRRGQRNEPSYIPLVAESLAALKKVPLQDLAQQTTNNARRLYRI